MTLKYSLFRTTQTIEDFIDKCNKKDVIDVEICLNTQDEIVDNTYGKHYISYEAKTESGKTFSFPTTKDSYTNCWFENYPVLSEAMEKDIKKLVRGLKKSKVNIKLGCKLIVDPLKPTYLTYNRMKKMKWR